MVSFFAMPFSLSFAGLASHRYILYTLHQKDPFSWMQSMCKSPYAAHWRHTALHCPNLVPTDADRERFKDHEMVNETFRVKVIFDKEQIFYWKSLVHLWSNWYRYYLEATYPRLMVRFEDMLFHGPVMMKKIAECVGAETPLEWKPQTKSAKGHGSGTDFLKAVQKTGDAAHRVMNLTPEDLQFAAENLDRQLLEIFRYQIPNATSTS